MNLFEKITDTELEMIGWSIANCAHHRKRSINKEYLAYILRLWQENKNEFLAKLFGGKLILTKYIDYQKSTYEIENELSQTMWQPDLIPNFCDAMKKKLLETNKYNSDQIWDLIWDITRLVRTECLAINRYRYDSFRFPLPNGKDLEIPEGCRPVKLLGKIAKAYGLTDIYEKIRLAHSQVLNDTKISGDLSISIHPLDYITMSDNDNNWESCMSWQNCGDYRLGTVEMMNSPFVIVAYLSSNSNEYYIGANVWNSKKWRSLYIIDPENIMCAVKGYPYQHKELDNIVLDWLIELASENIDKDNNFTKYKFIPGNEASCGFVSVNSDLNVELAMECNYMYNDFGTIDYHCCALSEKFVKNYKELKESDSQVRYYTIDYSGPTECMYCGEETEMFNGENSLVCENCDNRIRCNHCGDLLYTEDTYEVDGEFFCQYCYDNYVRVCPFTNKLMYYCNSINIRILKDPEKSLKDEELEDYFYSNREWHDFEINPEFFDSDEYSKYFKSPMQIAKTVFYRQHFLLESDLTEEAKNLLREKEDIWFFCDRK